MNKKVRKAAREIIDEEKNILAKIAEKQFQVQNRQNDNAQNWKKPKIKTKIF